MDDTSSEDRPSIAKLLVELAADDAGGDRDDFEADPDGFMQRKGLSEGQRAIVLSGDLGVIRNALRYEYASGHVPGRPFQSGRAQGIRLFIVWTPRPPPPPGV